MLEKIHLPEVDNVVSIEVDDWLFEQNNFVHFQFYHICKTYENIHSNYINNYFIWNRNKKIPVVDELVSVEEHVGVPLTNVVYDQILIYYTIRNW